MSAVESDIALISKIIAKFNDGTLTESNLNCVLDLDSTSDHFKKYENQSVRYSCVMKITELLFRLKDKTDLSLNYSQGTRLLKCIDFLVTYGFVPHLFSSVKNSFDYKQKINTTFSEDIPKDKGYEELKFIVDSFYSLTKEPNLKKIIMGKYTNVFLVGLSQLSLLPIAKPDTVLAMEGNINQLKYDQLINEQKQFENNLKELILIDRDPLVIRQIIFLLGRKSCQPNIKRGMTNFFTNLLFKPNGIQAILRVACDLSIEGSQDFCEVGTEKWSNLIHSYYEKSKVNYMEHIVPQIWQLLRSKTKWHQLQFYSVAVHCIYLISKENYNEFLEFYINPIDKRMNQSKLGTFENLLISQCIEDLHTLFYLFRHRIWNLNPKLMRYSATTIYNIYTATVNGVYYLNAKLEDLVFLILKSFSNCKDHLKLIFFSPYQIDVQYDCYGNVQIKYIEREHQLNLEYQAGLVLQLLESRQDFELMTTLFITLLNMYADVLSNEYSLMEKLFIVKCIYYLIEKDDVRDSLHDEHQEIVLNVIKLILKEIIDKNLADDQILSVALMVLDSILDKIDDKYEQLNSFLEYLPQIVEIIEDEDLKQLVLGTQNKIRNVQRIFHLWEGHGKYQKTIDDVLLEIRNPLLPCRAHALIELKKMIESGNSAVVLKKSAILIVIQENLKNADSYLYLSAIFTLSALCATCPNDILPILCEEYSMPKTYNYSSETRLKIGEVLMKTTKLLNETISVHKNQLLNSFIAGVRDDDNLVRASSLSNLGEICRILHFNLGSIIAEIVNCADYVLRYDTAVEPRRAALLLLHMVIQGADLELLEILKGSIKDIYKMLKYQYHCNKDSIIRLHAQAAIETLNDIMKSLFLNETK